MVKPLSKKWFKKLDVEEAFECFRFRESENIKNPVVMRPRDV